jgi:amino acid permease
MFHHSLPNIVNGLKNTQDVTFVIRNAFLISGSVLLVIPITGILAFG